jgi:uncharacterized membrane protein (UPF0127 family)
MAIRIKQDVNRKKKRTYCVFNQTRESFLSLGVTRADNHFARLKGLLGRLRLRSDDGIWLVPSLGIHTFGLLFPIDLVYLDTHNRVIHLVEHLRAFRVSPIRPQSASVLELPTRAIYSSQTQLGDRLLLCPAEDMETRLNRDHTIAACTAVSS